MNKAFTSEIWPDMQENHKNYYLSYYHSKQWILTDFEFYNVTCFLVQRIQDEFFIHCFVSSGQKVSSSKYLFFSTTCCTIGCFSCKNLWMKGRKDGHDGRVAIWMAMRWHAGTWKYVRFLRLRLRFDIPKWWERECAYSTLIEHRRDIGRGLWGRSKFKKRACSLY